MNNFFISFSSEEEKYLFLQFESVGAGTCVHVDFKDGIEQAYGDENYCGEWRPNVEFVPNTPITNPTEIPHIY